MHAVWIGKGIYLVNLSLFEDETTYSVKMSNKVALYTKRVYNKPWLYQSEFFSVLFKAWFPLWINVKQSEIIFLN